MRRRPPRHEEELAGIERLMRFIELFREYQDYSKILSTYTKFPITDGRVKGRYTIHGTKTGRLSSRDPNMQNIPPSAKPLFVATGGQVLVQADYSNLELRVLAEISDDEPLRAVFAEGKNVHDENTKALFGLDETSEKWKSARKASKTYVFGRNYGGGLRGIFERVSMAVPDLGLTFSRFVEADRRYREAHPAYAKWAEDTVARVRSTRTLHNAFGRVRFFLGRSDEIERTGLNFPIQSTAADILNFALIRLLPALPPGAKLCATVHDSVIVECDEGQVKEVVGILRQAMEAPVEIGGRSVSFPVDIEVGPSWGDLSETTDTVR